MAFTFPSNPADNDEFDVGNVRYRYNATKGGWKSISTSGGPSSVGGTTYYSTVDDLPLSGNTIGTLAYVISVNRLYMWNGTGWFNIALINETPTFSGNQATYNLATDGTPTVVTLTGSDPEELNIIYNYTTSGLGTTATIAQADNVFTITPSTLEADSGTFDITFTASDGVNIATSTSSVTLAIDTLAAFEQWATGLATNNAESFSSAFTDSDWNNDTKYVYIDNSVMAAADGGSMWGSPWNGYFTSDSNFSRIVRHALPSQTVFNNLMADYTNVSILMKGVWSNNNRSSFPSINRNGYVSPSYETYHEAYVTDMWWHYDGAVYKTQPFTGVDVGDVTSSYLSDS